MADLREAIVLDIAFEVDVVVVVTPARASVGIAFARA
jgi:hypothetical protein